MVGRSVGTRLVGLVVAALLVARYYGVGGGSGSRPAHDIL
jgi:hypothetical protein